MQQAKLFNLLKSTNIWFKIEIHDTEYSTLFKLVNFGHFFGQFAEFFGQNGHFSVIFDPKSFSKDPCYGKLINGLLGIAMLSLL